MMVNANGTQSQSMRNSLELAQHVVFGNMRYRLAEYHNMRGIARAFKKYC